MLPLALTHYEPEVHQFILRLCESRTMRYALNHSQMEAWVALEGLEHFSQRGWSSWETMGFISGQAVRPKKGTAQSIKFPDLVSVREDVCLWWEFKAIGTRTLHPKKAGGTFVKDVRALCAFDLENTVNYLKGHRSEARRRDDRSYIGASRLGDKLCASKQHVGVALIFAPGEDELECCNPDAIERRWRPAERLDELRREIEGIKRELATVDAAERIRKISQLGEAAGSELGGLRQVGGSGPVDGKLPPQWAGWMVAMAWSG